MKGMKPIVVFICSVLFFINAVPAQELGNTLIDIELKNASLEEAFTTIERLSPFAFNYKTADISGIGDITYRQHRVSVKKVLVDLLSHTSLQYEQIQNYILIKKMKNPARTVTVYGFVSAAHSGETLGGATVTVSGNTSWSAVTNTYGFYSLTVPATEVCSLSCSYVGFYDVETKAGMLQTRQHNIELTAKESLLLPPVTVATAKKNMVKRTLTGAHRFHMNDIKKMAMGGGEPDVLKSLQFLPGIQVAAEGTNNLSVRGGSYDQNLILLDEAPVYNPSHTLGFFSAFNTDALKDVAIYKGVFPAQYGGRLSSVVDIRMKEGNSKQPALAGGIGLLASRLTYEAPVEKEKSSFILSGRYSNIGLLLNLSHVSNLIKFRSNNSKVSFYDVNAKFNTLLGKKDRLYISAYTGHDQYFLPLINFSQQMNWGNTTVTARWNHVFHPALFANTSLLYSHYNYSYTSPGDTRNFTWRAHLQEATLKTDIDWVINANNQVKLGTGITFQEVLPGRVLPDAAGATSKAVSLNNRNSAQLFAYLGNEQTISKSLRLSYGVRVTGFAALGDALVYRYNADTTAVIDSTWYPKGKIIRWYMAAEPRITARILLFPSSSLKISYGRNYQFQHLLTNSSVGLPIDVWIPSDKYFKPQYADQLAAGVYRTFWSDAWEASAELYYRKSYNIIDFRDNAELFLNDKIETQVLTGHGKGYGLELLVRKNKGVHNGWISYTLSKSLRRIAGINSNEWYPAAYDHRHNWSLVYNYAITQRLHLSANWVYRSGGRTTIPAGTYIFNNTRFMYYGKRNGYTLPATHRLDISVVWQNRVKQNRKWQGEWNFSIYNVYNRKNVFALYVSQDPNDYSYAKATQVYLVSILPTVTYNFKF